VLRWARGWDSKCQRLTQKTDCERSTTNLRKLSQSMTNQTACAAPSKFELELIAGFSGSSGTVVASAARSLPHMTNVTPNNDT